MLGVESDHLFNQRTFFAARDISKENKANIIDGVRKQPNEVQITRNGQKSPGKEHRRSSLKQVNSPKL